MKHNQQRSGLLLSGSPTSRCEMDACDTRLMHEHGMQRMCLTHKKTSGVSLLLLQNGNEHEIDSLVYNALFGKIKLLVCDNTEGNHTCVSATNQFMMTLAVALASQDPSNSLMTIMIEAVTELPDLRCICSDNGTFSVP